MEPAINFKNFYFFNNTIQTENHILFSFCHFLSASIGYWEEKSVDQPIAELFRDGVFTEEHFVLIVGTFEFHHGISIPEIFLGYNQTVRQFIDRVAKLPKLDTTTYHNRVLDITKTIQEKYN